MNNTPFTPLIRKAIRFAIQTHEVDQKQKRKGKDIPYITHPLTVGLILSNVGAGEAIVAAGILHDTIEDSVENHKITRAILSEQFNEEVASLVQIVSETDKSLSWEERKIEALKHILTFSHGSILVKSADVLSNNTELIDDFIADGESVWNRFNAPKEKALRNTHEVVTALLTAWPESPLAGDLLQLREDMQIFHLNGQIDTAEGHN